MLDGPPQILLVLSTDVYHIDWSEARILFSYLTISPNKHFGYWMHRCIPPNIILASLHILVSLPLPEILHVFKIELQERVLQKCFLLILILIENGNDSQIMVLFQCTININHAKTSLYMNNGYRSISFFLKFISEIIIETSFMGF